MGGPERTASRRPEAVVFDVNETLTNLAALEDVFATIGLGGTLRWWFAVLLRDGFALTAAGDAARFGELALVALDEVAAASGQNLPEGAGALVIDALGSVPAHPDVLPALDQLASAGIAAFALTNGSAPLAQRILRAAGVVDRFSDVLSVDAVGHWKPRPEPYRYAAEVAGVSVDRVAMIAVHPWDLHGAASAGMMTGWVNRDERQYPAIFHAPLVRSTDLDGVIQGLLALESPT